MKRERREWSLPVAGSAWTQGAGRDAGVFYLDGGCHIVALSSPAEQHLRASGALQIATIGFGPDPFETRRAERSVRPLGTAEALRRFGPAPPRN